jgi:parvulin-like peptidyl-prolyl isomerase
VSPSKGKRPTGRGRPPAKAPDKRGRGRQEAQRLAALAFGAAFVILFVVVAIAEGVGQPGVPAGAIAFIDGMPSDAIGPLDKPYKDCQGKTVTQDLAVVTEAEYECAFKQLAAGSGLKTPPKPGDEQYDALHETTIAQLIENTWLLGLGAEEGITVSIGELKEKEEEIVEKEFEGSRKKFSEFLKTSGYTTQEVNEKLMVGAVSQKLAEPLEAEVEKSKPSKGEIEEAYEADKSTRFTQPETRDIRILTNKDKKKVEEAKAALEKDNSAKAWKTAIKKYAESPATASTGGLQPGVTEEQYPGEVGEAMFAAPKGKLEGPFKFTLGDLIFQVEKVTPEKVRPLGEAEAEIKAELEQKKKENIFNGFIESFRGDWRSRTFCASDFTIEKSCANFSGTAKVEGISPSCYEEVSKKQEKEEEASAESEGCPAPVIQLKPGLPGTVSIVAEKGTQLAQRPQPPGLESSESSSLPSFLPSEVPTSP